MRRWWAGLWWGLLALLLVFEGISLLDGRADTPPLTEVLVTHPLAGEAAVGVSAWLLIHLVVRVWRRRE